MKTEPIVFLQELYSKSDILAKKIRDVENNSEFQRLFSHSDYLGPSWQEELLELENLIHDIKVDYKL